MPTYDQVENLDMSPKTYTFNIIRLSDGVSIPTDFVSNVDFVSFTPKTRTVPPLSTAGSSIEDHPDGLSYAQAKRHNIIKMTDRGVFRSSSTKHIIMLPFQFAKLVFPWENDQALAVPAYPQGEWHVKEPLFRCTMDTPFEIIGAPEHEMWNPSAINLEVENDIENAVYETKRVVVADSYQTWDALTSAAELPKAMKLFSRLLRGAVNPLSSFARLLNDSKSPKKLAGRWLEYRYGIMPTILEIQDIFKLIGEVGFAFKTSRSSRKGYWEQPKLPPDTLGPLKFAERSEDWRVAAVGKARYGTSSLRALDQISLNPALTAWELIPFSFVVDWFINVGDFIQARSLDLNDYSEQRMFCVSIKRTKLWRQYYRRSYLASFASPQYDSVGNVYHWPNKLDDHSDYLIRDGLSEQYSRRIFYPSDAGLSVQPNLNWSRFLDSIALTIRSTTTSIRNLRI